MTTATKSRARLHDDYLALVLRLPLKHISTEVQLRAAQRMIDELVAIPDSNRTRGQGDYLDALSDLTDVYETRLMAADLASVTGLDLLKHLTEENDLGASDLGRLLGNRELGSKILRGERNISKTHAKILGNHFATRAELFLR